MDRIFLDSLPVSVRIGTLPEERTKKQEIILHAVLTVDLREAGQTDDLSKSVDYSQVEETLFRSAENSSFLLLEALAEHLCQVVLSGQPRVQSIRLRIDKPGAPRRAGGISIEIERTRSTPRSIE